MSADHGRLIRNTVIWALNEESVADVSGPGVIDVTVWRQNKSMTVHLVNLTNPMMMKGPFHELIPVDAEVSIRIPENAEVKGVKLLVRDQKPRFITKDGRIILSVPQIPDHEIIALDL